MICNAALWVVDATECWVTENIEHLVAAQAIKEQVLLRLATARYMLHRAGGGRHRMHWSVVSSIDGENYIIYYLMIFAPRHFWTLVHKFPIDYYHYFAWLSINQPRLRGGKAEENIEVNFQQGHGEDGHSKDQYIIESSSMYPCELNGYSDSESLFLEML